MNTRGVKRSEGWIYIHYRSGTDVRQYIILVKPFRRARAVYNVTYMLVVNVLDVILIQAGFLNWEVAFERRLRGALWASCARVLQGQSQHVGV